MVGGGVETLFGRIPFEQHLCYAGSSLSLILHPVISYIPGRKDLKQKEGMNIYIYIRTPINLHRYWDRN